nr:MAG TPA: hypothetical protein [Caudoviricetes sp.]
MPFRQTSNFQYIILNMLFYKALSILKNFSAYRIIRINVLILP